jgi:hypothetical protein
MAFAPPRVYSDWLEGRGDSRADLLRPDAEWKRIANRGRWDTEGFKLRAGFAASLDPHGLAAVNAVNDERGDAHYSVRLLGDEFSARDVGRTGGPGSDYDADGSDTAVSARSRNEGEEGHPDWTVWINLRSTSPHVISVRTWPG